MAERWVRVRECLLGEEFRKGCSDKGTFLLSFTFLSLTSDKRQASIYVPAVGKVTILMLLRNLSVQPYSPRSLLN